MDKLRRILLSIVAFIFLIILGLVSGFLLQDKKKNFSILEIGSQSFEVEIADNVLNQARGLSGRDSLPENQGMLFIFPDLGQRSFWMAGMKFPLDIIWIRDNKVIGFSENLPPASSVNVQLYNPSEAVDKVLEINAGLVKKLGIREGDKIVLK
ncbi:MAG: DUF192 domain-containing protein [bacterium]|nr:DUF192 domain-containing protein [bacterium]